MRTSIIYVCVVLLAVALLPTSPAQADDREWAAFGRLTVEGVVTSFNPSASTLVLRVMRPERALRLGHVIVWVQRGTRIDGDGDTWFGRPAQDFGRGDRIKVDGFRLDDGRLLALDIDVKERAFALRPTVGEVVFRGVLVARGSALIVILDSSGRTRIILIATTTRIRGRRASMGALQANDTVVVLGEANPDGTVVAREVQVTETSR